MFAGSFLHSIDSKGRLTIPARFASYFGGFYVVTRGLQGCLWVFTDQEWARVVQKLGPDSLVDSKGLALQRYFLGSATEGTLDGQSRIAIPQMLRDYAALKREVVVVGAGNRLELWSKDRWDEISAQLTDEQIEKLAREAGL